jgi:uncharacterized integral membrane protein (TIGR00697 family)
MSGNRDSSTADKNSAMADTPHWLIPEGMGLSTMVFTAMVTLFITCLVVANLVGSVLFSFQSPFGWLSSLGLPERPLLSAGIIFFPITFLLTDLLNEFYGARAARFVTMLGFGSSLFVFVLMATTERLPVDERSLLSVVEFGKFSSLYTGMVVASLTAYLIGQFLDIQVFAWFRERTKNRFIWLRAQGSTLISQGFDSFIVVWIAFAGQLDAESIWLIGWSNYLWKIALVAAVTPFLYLGHSFLRGILAPKETT